MSRNFKRIALLVALVFALNLVPAAAMAGSIGSSMILATTTSTQDSGLLDVLVPAFEKKYDITVKVIAVGSGQAMEMGQKGDADVLLVHSRKAEDEFVAAGYGINRKDVMHNQFLIVGPASDPAGLKGSKDAVASFKKIAASGSKFISRADKSGTNAKELSIWAKAGMTPSGAWYVESGQGMGDTLMMASELKAYTLTDEATFLTWKGKLELIALEHGDKILFNPYGVIEVNPAKNPGVNNKAAAAFANFLVSKEGQALIANFGVAKYGKGLFVPDAVIAPAPAPKVAATGSKMKVTASALNVRTGPSTKYKILGVLKKGTIVTVTGKVGYWYKVTYKNRTAYLSSRYLAAVK